MHSSSLFHILISHPHNGSVLATSHNLLPSLRYEGDYYSDPQHICSLVEKAIGASFRLDFLHPDAEEFCHFYYRAALLVFIVLQGDELDAPPSYKWVPINHADTINVHPRKVPVLQYLRKYKVRGLDANGERLRSYSKANWFSDASKWFKERVEQFGNTQVHRIVKLRTGSSACILQAKTVAAKDFYMKTVVRNKLYDEIGAVYAMSTVMPQYFRKPFAIDRAQNCFCMEDYGKVLSGDECNLMENPELVDEILDEWGCIQEASIQVMNELKLEGVPVLGGKDILNKLETIVSDPQWYDAQLVVLKRLNMKEYVRDEYIDRFMRYANGVAGKASEFKVPLTLVHGDLSPANVARSPNGRFTFFDFEATCISYPLLDAMNFVFVCNDFNKATFDDLWFYTQRWGEHESEERLKEYFEAVSEIENLISVCNSYESWVKAEEGERLLMFSEMGSPVSKHFEAWEESRRNPGTGMTVD